MDINVPSNELAWIKINHKIVAFEQAPDDDVFDSIYNQIPMSYSQRQMTQKRAWLTGSLL